MQKLMAFFDRIFGCHHSQLSRVFTICGRTYLVCCTCGATFDYSLEIMGIRRPRRKQNDATQKHQ
jgi:hypothetical protein